MLSRLVAALLAGLALSQGAALSLAEPAVGLAALEEDKRATSLGFSGMRGKRDEFEDAHLEKRSRNTLGFSGMRGKKDEFEDADDGLEKRARNALGFSGMRGKKNEFEDADADVDLEKRARNNLGFSGMRGKKDDSFEFDDGPDKRARNNLGFSGMRGKKDDFDDGEQESLYDKRARSALGFSGMRGKKDEIVMEDLMDKRGSNRNTLGFSGMRGKKDADDWDAFLAKRARGQASFVGLRGRRENAQAFFGLRGKRAEGADAADEDDVLGYLQSAGAARDGVVTFRSKRYLPTHWHLRNSKKAPFAGFIGLRGKKSFAEPSL